MGVEQDWRRLGERQQWLSLSNAERRMKAVKPLPLPMVSKARPRHCARRLQALQRKL